VWLGCEIFAAERGRSPVFQDMPDLRLGYIPCFSEMMTLGHGAKQAQALWHKTEMCSIPENRAEFRAGIGLPSFLLTP